MADRVRFLMSFRARLVLLVASFLVLAIVLVFTLDNLFQKRIENEVEQQNLQVKEAVNTGFGDFARAISLSQGSLNNSETFLYEAPQDVPPTIEHIIIADENGKVNDSTSRDLIDQHIDVPPLPVGFTQGLPGDPVERPDVPLHGGLVRTYNLPIWTT